MTTSITGLTNGLQQSGLRFDSTNRRQEAAEAVETTSRTHDEVNLTGIPTEQDAADALSFITQSASEGADLSNVHGGLDPARVARLIGLFDDE